jgi:hypothetical protein
MNTCFETQANRKRRSQSEQILQPNLNPRVQNNQLPPSFPLSGNNRDEQEEEHNSHANVRDLWEDNRREQRNGRANHHGGQQEDAGDLSRIVAELERRCTYMEME